MRTLRVNVSRPTVCLPSYHRDFTFAVHKTRATSCAAGRKRRIRRSSDAQLHSSTISSTHGYTRDPLLLSLLWILANDVPSERAQKHMQDAAAKDWCDNVCYYLSLWHTQQERCNNGDTEKAIGGHNNIALYQQSYAHCHARHSLTHDRLLIKLEEVVEDILYTIYQLRNVNICYTYIIIQF